LRRTAFRTTASPAIGLALLIGWSVRDASPYDKSTRFGERTSPQNLGDTANSLSRSSSPRRPRMGWASISCPTDLMNWGLVLGSGIWSGMHYPSTVVINDRFGRLVARYMNRHAMPADSSEATRSVVGCHAGGRSCPRCGPRSTERRPHAAACVPHGDQSHLVAARDGTSGDRVDALALVKLTALMERTRGRAEVTIGVIDGPVLMGHPDLTYSHLLDVSGSHGPHCTQVDSSACVHGTFVTGMLAAKRDSPAPAICPGCTVLIRPIFDDSRGDGMPSATPQELAGAILECVDRGARIINLSLAFVEPSTAGNRQLEEALNQTVRRGVIVVAAAGNQGTLGSSTITRHPWVIPVVGCDQRGQPLRDSNLGRSIGSRGVTAPSKAITSLGPQGRPLTLSGTSVAVPFVTGAIALLSSEFPAVPPAEIKLAVTQASGRRASLVPPLLDASAAYEVLSARKETGA